MARGDLKNPPSGVTRDRNNDRYLLKILILITSGQAKSKTPKLI